MGLRATLDAVVKRKIPSPRRESSPRTPIELVRSLVALLTELSRLLFLLLVVVLVVVVVVVVVVVAVAVAAAATRTTVMCIY
jgi:hypothetical protein